MQYIFPSFFNVNAKKVSKNVKKWLPDICIDKSLSFKTQKCVIRPGLSVDLKVHLHLIKTLGSDVHNHLNEVSKAKDFIKALKESSIN